MRSPSWYRCAALDPVEAFRRRLLAQGLSSNTVESYVTDIELFRRFLESTGKGLEDATQDDVIEFLGWMRDRGYSQSTIARRLCAIRAFWALVKGGRLDVKWKGRERRLPTWLTEEEVNRLIAACDSVRDRALLTLMYDAALRVSEVVNLTIDDVDFRERTVRVRGKGGKERVIPITSRSVNALQAYLATREDSSPYLFPGRTPDQPLDRTTVYRIIRRAAQRAGIKKPVHPHTLRHSRATILRRKGMDLGELRLFLGHSDISTTVIYDHIVLEDIMKRMRQIGEV